MGQYIICSQSEDVKELPYKTYSDYGNLRWKSFDYFKKASSSCWFVRIEKDSWKSAVCTCSVYSLKNYKCKHSIGLAIRLKLTQPPIEAKQVAIGQKRKRVYNQRYHRYGVMLFLYFRFFILKKNK
ncbi:hypothetical protein DERF_008551 [Dermatophagoides farinae]|uniref:SWIM-type domain-containing protein n=1 Tax=Dermatophagoides farinae TaxID=6954 RepID=A0A922I2M5_DERFA|nr:hypothetical protein DERF_008551 [Dermatophagoides farinae]